MILGKVTKFSEDVTLNLIELKQENFEYREWIALKYAQEWAFHGGEKPSGKIADEFKKHYSYKERAWIEKIIRIQRLANYSMNLLHKRGWIKSTKKNVCYIGSNQTGNLS
ncbi:MAG: hypothetical protein KJ737_27300 [Proteobacteria bacterium]|nr:hypothetical protein [Pseudomonadota bacterium]